MTDSPALSLLRGLKDRLDISYAYDHSWEGEHEGCHEAGFVIAVQEGAGYRKLRITVTDLGLWPASAGGRGRASDPSTKSIGHARSIDETW